MAICSASRARIVSGLRAGDASAAPDQAFDLVEAKRRARPPIAAPSRARIATRSASAASRPARIAASSGGAHRFVGLRVGDVDHAADRRVSRRASAAGRSRRPPIRSIAFTTSARTSSLILMRWPVDSRVEGQRGLNVAAGEPGGAAFARPPTSMRSMPGGRRRRTSRPLPLTLRISQVQRRFAAAPSERAKPVMLVRAMAGLRSLAAAGKAAAAALETAEVAVRGCGSERRHAFTAPASGPAWAAKLERAGIAGRRLRLLLRRLRGRRRRTVAGRGRVGGRRPHRASARRPGATVHLPPARDIAQVIFVGLGEGVTAGAVGDEEEIAGARRIGDRLERGAAGIGDRARRQARRRCRCCRPTRSRGRPC